MNTLGIFLQGTFTFLSQFICSIMDYLIWTLEYLFYIWDFHLILFVSQVVGAVAIGYTFRIAPGVPWTHPHPFVSIFYFSYCCFLLGSFPHTLLLSGTAKSPTNFVFFSLSFLESVISLRPSGSFYWIMVFIQQQGNSRNRFFHRIKTLFSWEANIYVLFYLSFISTNNVIT